MLGGLKGDRHARVLAELARPHPCAVDDVLRFDVAARRPHSGDGAAFLQERGDRGLLDDPHAAATGATGQRHRHVDGIGPPVAWDVEPGEDVIGAGEREQPCHLTRRDLVDVDTAVAVEGGDATVFLEPVGVGGELDEADRAEPRGLSRLGFEPGVEVAGVGA